MMSNLTRNRVKKFLPVGLKLIIMGFLIVLIAEQVSWDDYEVIAQNGEILRKPGLATSMTSFSYCFFGVALLFQFLSVTLGALRWRLLMNVQGIRINRLSTMLLTFLGEFFNHLLPGAVGGDLAKAYYMIRHNNARKGATLASIFANRFIGLVTLTIIALGLLITLIATGKSMGNGMRHSAAALVIIALLAFLFTLLSINKKLYNSGMIRKLLTCFPGGGKVESLRQALHRYRTMGPLLVPVVLYSLLIVIFYVMSIMFVGMSLGVSVPWYQYFVYIPVIAIMSSLPVTPGGVGVFEELLLFFLGHAGAPSKILAMALVCRLVLVLCAIPGAIIFMGSKKISQEEIRRTVSA